MPVERLPWHAPAWDLLQARRRAGSLPHALLISGPAGLGKLALAERLGAALVCEAPAADGEACGACRACTLAAAGNHPDLVRLVPEEPGKPLRIDAIRALGQRSTLTPEGPGYRVFILAPADALTPGAANALLKTLEEPVPRSVFVLVSSRPERLPATVRSRCQKVVVAPPPAAEAGRWLRGQGPEGERAAALLGLAGGGPLRALALAAGGQGERLLEAGEELARLVQGRADPVELAASWHKMGSEGVLGYLAQWATDLVRLKIGDNPPMLFHTGHESALRELAARVELRRVFELLDEVALNRRRISHNLNPQLLTERLLIQCSELSSR